MKRIFSAKRVTAASVLMAALTSGQALADDKTFVVRMSVDGEMKVPDWLTINYIYGEWTSVGEHHSCQDWVAPPETVDWGSSFQQSRLCKQSQTRLETPVLFNPVLKTTKEGVAVTGRRDVSATEFRSNIGTRDYIDGERANNYGAWTRNSSNYDCGEWSPKPSDVNLLESFTQSRTCSKDEIRVRDVFHVWASGKETFKRKDSEEQTVSEIEQQGSTGTKDYINAVRVDNWTPWAVEGEAYGCQTWSPAPNTINLNQNFQQSRSCSQKEISDRDIFDVWRSGKETLNDNEPRSRVVIVSQVQDNVGTKDFIKTTRNDEWTAWTNSAAPYGCSDWTPEKNTVKLDENFTQTRNCSQGQVRERDIINVWESGEETLNRVENASKVITVEQSQASVGTLDYIVSQTTPAWSSWSNDGTPYNCATWSPSVDTVNLNQSFTQSRQCSQNQDRSRTIENVWKSGKKTFNREETDDQTITVTQNKSATGTKNFIVTEKALTWAVWGNVASPYNCSAWTPTPGTVNLGDSYKQTRSCKQDQTRSRTVNNVWEDGSETKKRTDEDEQTITVTQSQTVTGTKDYIVSTRTGSYDAWGNLGDPYECNAWSPAPNTVNLNKSYTQSRDCKQNQDRERTIYNVWKSGKETELRSETDAKTIIVTQNKQATGSKDFIKTTEIRSWSAWSNNGTPFNCSAWSPTVDTVNLGTKFNQSRDCSQKQDRSRDIYDVWESGKKTYKSTEGDAQTITVGQTKESTGTKNFKTGGISNGEWSAWSNDGNPHTCSTWLSAVDTVNLGEKFNQSRSCKQDQTRSRQVYDVWADGTKTPKSIEGDEQTITVSQSQSATGTKNYKTGTLSYSSWSAWSNDGAVYECETWSPSASTVNLGSSFTQNRSCEQDQKRSRIVYDVWADGTKSAKTTQAGTQTISVGQSQTATGSKDFIESVSNGAWGAWSNSGNPTGCGVWSPSTGTVNLGDSFTQSRSCDQAQTRTRTIYNMWKSGKKTVKTTETGNQSVTVTQSQSATGAKDYKTGEVSYGPYTAYKDSGEPNNCGAWSPAASTVNLGSSFTQTRECRQSQSRQRTVYDVWKSGKTTAKSTQASGRTIDVTQSQTSTGTKDYITTTSAGSWGSWSNSGNPTGCGSWSPATGTVNLGESFTQSRSCDQAQTRTRTIYNVWKSGERTAKTTETGNQSVTVTQSQSATGAKDYKTGEVSYGPYTAYKNSGEPNNCGAWSPLESTVNLGSSFTQTRECRQSQSRQRIVYDVWKSGKTTEKSTQGSGRTIDVTQSQSATGTKDYITTTSAGSWSSWSNNGSPTGCGGWSPATGTVNLGESFTQSRSCDQAQKRTRTIYNVWKSGKRTTKTTETGNQSVTVTQSQSATGAKDYKTGEVSYGPYTAYKNSGEPNNCGTWSPAESTVNLGSSFTQTRECRQSQSRQRTVYDVWKSGKTTEKSTQGSGRTIDVTQSQPATGTKDYVTTTSAGSWSSWSNSGSPTGCGGWSPSTGTVNLGDSFTQSRSCDQAQKRTRTIYNVWKSGDRTAKTTETGNQSVTVTQSQSATGAKDYITGELSYGPYSAYTNSGSPNNCETWSPAASTVNLGSSFTQTRECRQSQSRQRTVYDVWKSGKTTAKYTQGSGRTIDVTQSQSATGTKNYVTGTSYGSWGGWSNSGGAYSCGGYSPSTSTINLGSSFTQSRSCSQNQTRSRTVYNVWKNGVKTYKSTDSGSQTISVTQSKAATGTKDYITGSSNGSWSSWSNSGGVYSCSGYSPSTSTVDYGKSFTQNRSCSQKQVRSRTIYNVWKSGKKTTKTTEAGSQVISVNQSRTATGTKNIVVSSQSSTGAWFYTASAVCGGWSPSTSGVNSGSSFTQKQSCSRARARDTTVYNVWTNGTKTVKSSSRETGVYYYSNYRTAKGTKDYVTSSAWNNSYSYTYSDWSCGSYSPSVLNYPDGHKFTQSRTCSRTKYRNKRYYQNWKLAGRVYTGSTSVYSTSTESKVETRDAWGVDLSCGGYNNRTGRYEICR